MPTTKKLPQIGIVIDCSSDSADDRNRETCQYAQAYGWELDEPSNQIIDRLDNNEPAPGDSQLVSELADEAINFLNCLDLPPYCSFQFDDNSLFLSPDLQSAKEDCEFISSKDQEFPDEDFRGEFLHVNDHGNVTLYVRGEDGQDKEIWSIV